MIARFGTHKRLKTHKPGWCIIVLLGLAVAGCGVRTNASPTSPDASTSITPVPPSTGDLIFQGQYAHRSRGRDFNEPSELRLKKAEDGGIVAEAYMSALDTTTIFGDKKNRIVRCETKREASGNKPAYRWETEFGEGKAWVTRRGIREDLDRKEIVVPAGAAYDPNSRPDTYCAANILLRGFALEKGQTKDFRVYDIDNAGEGYVEYSIRIEHKGKERVEVPAGAFEANHLVLTQVSSANTWFKKRAGHVTEFWVLDNHVIVRVLRHREPYEIQLLKCSVPEKLPGQVSVSAEKATSTAEKKTVPAASENQSVVSGPFLQPTKPLRPGEAGDLWAMPQSDGRLRISPLRQWSRTGLDLRQGQRLEIKAEGSVQGCQRPVGAWAYGPFGPSGGPAVDNPESRVCALIGRIVGEKETREFVVGETYQGEAPFSGRLDLGVSDVVHFDNSGEFLAAMRVDGAPVDCMQRRTVALTAPTKDLAPMMRPTNGVEVQELGGVRRMSAPREADMPMLATEQCFTPPLEIRARVRTDSTNVRLFYGYFGCGLLIFNWEVRPGELRVHDPGTGKVTAFPGAGNVEKDKYHDIVWRVEPRRMQVLVDGEERYRGIGDYGAVASQVGIGPALGSQVDVGSLVVAPLAAGAIDESAGVRASSTSPETSRIER